MSVDAITAFLAACSIDVEIDFRIVTQCAPVLKGIKASNLISLKQGMWKLVKKRLQGSGIHCISLYLGEQKEILLLYRRDLLRKHLHREEVQRFLCEHGYLDLSEQGVLIHLQQRYSDYMNRKIGFPHELGILLEYPTKDVQGFIKNQGRNCLMEKYWKVYHDKENAEKMFRLYDEAKEKAMKEIVAGYPLYKVAVS